MGWHERPERKFSTATRRNDFSCFNVKGWWQYPVGESDARIPSKEIAAKTGERGEAQVRVQLIAQQRPNYRAAAYSGHCELAKRLDA